tara:strand:+ start:425 stop:1870 length:1446 start_codon:yes stop_codon:yes gene_type:complete
MAFLRYARANVVQPSIHGLEWDKVRVASGSKTINSSLKKQAEDILGEPFTPDRFLLTHSTIVCSVDAITPPNTKTGSIEEGGQTINRKYADYRVSSDTDKFINNNLDSWSRGVIKKSYQTFIGAHNFVEHIQVEELSKGRIIDAVLRDIGDSLYVDILVATDRKHKDLVKQIESGQMNAMSMGCSVDFTICTKCGHVAADETEMCSHVKYEKGNTFFDEQGNKHRVAELCGHEDIGGTAGVTFIEASWVATPAFTGAVARNTLEIPNAETTKSASEETLNEVPKKWIAKASSLVDSPWYDPNGQLTKKAGPFDMDDDEDGGDDNADAPSESLLQQLETVYETAIVDRFRQKLENEIKAEKAQEVMNPPIDKSVVEQNDTIVKEGQVNASEYMSLLDASVKTASSVEEAVLNISLVNTHCNVHIPTHIYKLASLLGSTSQYNDVVDYLEQASYLNGKTLSKQDTLRLVRLAKLISLNTYGQK